MKKISQKEQEKFLRAYDELSDALFRHTFFRVSEREIALDLVQEAFFKAWDYLCQGKEIQNLRAFIYQIVNNLIIDYYRKRKTVSLDVLSEDENFDPPENTHEDILGNAEVSVIRSALAKLPDEYREVMVMRYVDGLTIEEISETIVESENVVSVRIHRATKKMREILKI